MAMLFAVALITGMSVSGDGIDLFGLIGLAYIVNIAAGLFASGIALRFRTIQAGPLMQTPVFLILFLAPVYVPAVAADRLDPRGRERQPGDRDPRTAPVRCCPAPAAGSRSRSSSPPRWWRLLAPFAVRGLRRAEDAGA